MKLHEYLRDMADDESLELDADERAAIYRAAAELEKAHKAGVEFMKRADYCREVTEDDRLIGDYPLTRDMYDQARKLFEEALQAIGGEK